ncbi:MAG TPA: sigma-70 family RNA polymerase sigma factor [Candidatus Acutalibacter stercorigallinarum]|nr:sigma-70 family RNA polymerase sigma factor [Candidatus Acutalibacter stercorigallinarum]
MEQELLRLVKLARAGDREAFTRLVLSQEGMLSRVAMGILKNPDDAADAVQDAVLEAWQGMEKLRQPRYFKTWLVRILMTKCYHISSLRSKHNHSPLEEALDAGSLPDWDQALDVGNTLRSLRPEDQMILGLFYYDGLSVRDIAKALGISEDSVKQRLHRGRKRFQAAYLEKEELCHEK